jgi:hypothetical protein
MYANLELGFASSAMPRCQGPTMRGDSSRFPLLPHSTGAREGALPICSSDLPSTTAFWHAYCGIVEQGARGAQICLKAMRRFLLRMSENTALEVRHAYSVGA